MYKIQDKHSSKTALFASKVCSLQTTPNKKEVTLQAYMDVFKLDHLYIIDYLKLSIPV